MGGGGKGGIKGGTAGREALKTRRPWCLTALGKSPKLERSPGGGQKWGLKGTREPSRLGGPESPVLGLRPRPLGGGSGRKGPNLRRGWGNGAPWWAMETPARDSLPQPGVLSPLQASLGISRPGLGIPGRRRRHPAEAIAIDSIEFHSKKVRSKP